MIKAVIFDRDGVLVDSEFANVRAGDLAFKELGVTLTDVEKASIVGRHVDDYAKPLLQKYHIEYATFRQLQRTHYYALLETIPIFKHTIALIKNLHTQGMALALCTSSSKDSTIPLLKKLGIADCFRVITTTEDYTKRKPDPEPYEFTAKKLGLSPEDCLVVEDSEIGLRSARAAGMRCVVIFNTFTKDHDFSGAEVVVDSAEKLDVPGLLNKPSPQS